MYSEKKKILCYAMAILLGVTTMFQGTAIVGAATLTNNSNLVEESNETFDVSKNAKGQIVYTLKGDVTQGLNLELKDGETAVLDGAGHTIAGKDAHVRGSDGYYAATQALQVVGDGKLIIRDATFVGGSMTESAYMGTGKRATDGSEGIKVSENCSLIFEDTVNVSGGNEIIEESSSPDEPMHWYIKKTGLNFDANQMIIKSESTLNITSEGNNASLSFKGNLLEREDGATLTLSNGLDIMINADVNSLVSDNLKELYQSSLGSDTLCAVTVKALCNQKVLQSNAYNVRCGNESAKIKDVSALPVLSSEEYELIGYYTDEQLSTPLENGAQVTDNMVIYAKYERLIKDITFNSNGGSSVAKQEVKVGEKLTKPTDPTMAGYTFKGWYTDKELTKVFSFDTVVNEDMTLYAKWEKILDPTTATTAVQKPTKVAMSQATIGKIKAVTYSGYAKKPSVKVTYQGKTLKKGTDYTVSYKNNKKVGTAKVIVTGKGNYAGTKTATFNIKKRKKGTYAKGIYIVNVSRLNGHKKPVKKSKVVITYPEKAKLEVTKVIKKKTSKKTYIWLKVKYKGKSSYVYSKYVK